MDTPEGRIFFLVAHFWCWTFKVGRICLWSRIFSGDLCRSQCFAGCEFFCSKCFRHMLCIHGWVVSVDAPEIRSVFFWSHIFDSRASMTRSVFFLLAHFQWQTLRHVRRAPQDAAKRFQVAQGWRQSLNKRIVLSGHAFVSAPSERGNVVVFFLVEHFFCRKLSSADGFFCISD